MKGFVTGGSGFIGSHIVDVLLNRGYDVVATVRTHEYANTLRNHYSNIHAAQLEYVVVNDISREDALCQALTSDHPFDFVIHTASPFTQNFSDPVTEMLEPAIKGTTALLKAVKKSAPTVKRVVITSSLVAMLDQGADVKVCDGRTWNSVTWDEAVQNPRLAYTASKTLAERAAWDFIWSEKPSFDIVSINPGLVFGPLLHDLGRINTSNQRIADMVHGKFAQGRLPPTGIHFWVDVRDMALAHVRAVEVPAAGFERFVVATGPMSNKAVCDLIYEDSPELRDKLPSGTVDDTPPGLPMVTSQKAVEILDLKFRPLVESVRDTVGCVRNIKTD